VAKSAKEKAV